MEEKNSGAMKKALLLVLALAVPSLLYANEQWVLVKSTLTYHVSHPLHEADGVSHEARGKGACAADHCDFLIGVPVKSFESGDSNRDLHMIEVVRGAEFPMVAVRTSLPAAEIKPGTVHADLEIQFAGQTAQYKQVAFQLSEKGDEITLTGTIPATVSDFKIEPPKLLMMPIKNEIPVRVEMTWKEQK